MICFKNFEEKQVEDIVEYIKPVMKKHGYIVITKHNSISGTNNIIIYREYGEKTGYRHVIDILYKDGIVEIILRCNEKTEKIVLENPKPLHISSTILALQGIPIEDFLDNIENIYDKREVLKTYIQLTYTRITCNIR